MPVRVKNAYIFILNISVCSLSMSTAIHTGFLVKILTSNNLADTFVWGPSLRNFSSRRDMIGTTFILENFTPEIVRFSDKCEN